MLLLAITFDVINGILSLIAVIILTVLVFRTKNGLDVAFKFYLASIITLMVVSFIGFNKYWDLLPHEYADAIFQTSRILALIFFIIGSLRLLSIVTKKSEE